MGLWLLDADTLARSRFVVSPLAETFAALLDLEEAVASRPDRRSWLAAHLPSYRARSAGDEAVAAVVRAGVRHGWIADFLVPAPVGDGVPRIEEELRRVRCTPPAAARADLPTALGGRPLPEALRRDDLGERAAALLEWVWTTTVLPDWERRRRILEADVVSRTRQLSDGGWASALNTLRPRTRWLGEGRLRINAQDNPPRDISGAQLLLVPVTARRGWVSWDEPGRYAVVYPCAGVLAETGRPVPRALGALLGPGRARILVLLGTPMSTTQLVAVTGLALGSVGRHLKVLLDAGLVRRRRAGRSVLYYRTGTGDALAGASGTEAGSATRGRRRETVRDEAGEDCFAEGVDGGLRADHDGELLDPAVVVEVQQVDAVDVLAAGLRPEDQDRRVGGRSVDTGPHAAGALPDVSEVLERPQQHAEEAQDHRLALEGRELHRAVQADVVGEQVLQRREVTAVHGGTETVGGAHG
jgi:DNA-binding transcriptional ArsR family regulator